MDPRRAIYAGSFDPITNGHLDIIGRAAAVFDDVVVAVGSNPRKQYLFDIEQRVDLARQAIGDQASVLPFEGLLAEFARAQGCGVIVRGLRGGADFEFEQLQGRINRDLAPEIETVMLLSAPSQVIVSSSMVREIAACGGDPSPYVPAVVAAALAERYRA